jgi:hypothetical protein
MLVSPGVGWRNGCRAIRSHEGAPTPVGAQHRAGPEGISPGLDWDKLRVRAGTSGIIRPKSWESTLWRLGTRLATGGSGEEHRNHQNNAQLLRSRRTYTRPAASPCAPTSGRGGRRTHNPDGRCVPAARLLRAGGGEGRRQAGRAWQGALVAVAAAGNSEVFRSNLEKIPRARLGYGWCSTSRSGMATSSRLALPSHAAPFHRLGE